MHRAASVTQLFSMLALLNRPRNGKSKNQTLIASNAIKQVASQLAVVQNILDKDFLRIYPETAHTIASSTTLAFHPHFFLCSSHLDTFYPLTLLDSFFTPLSFPFLYPVLWLLTTTSSKGTSCPRLFFRVGIFERFMLTHHRKPFQVISKLGVRYTGIFDHISQEDQTICLAQGMSLSLH